MPCINAKKYFLKQKDVLKIKSYSLIVQDALTAGKVIIALEKIEVSNVDIEKIEFSEVDELRLALKSKAIIKARQHAESMCSPLNQKVGNAIFISDLSDNYRANQMHEGVAGVQIRGYSPKYDKEFKLADVQFEKIKVESTVNVKFKIE